MKPRKLFELAVYSFGNTPRTVTGGHGETVQANRDTREVVKLAEGNGQAKATYLECEARVFETGSAEIGRLGKRPPCWGYDSERGDGANAR